MAKLQSTPGPIGFVFLSLFGHHTTNISINTDRMEVRDGEAQKSFHIPISESNFGIFVMLWGLNLDHHGGF